MVAVPSRTRSQVRIAGVLALSVLPRFAQSALSAECITAIQTIWTSDGTNECFVPTNQAVGGEGTDLIWPTDTLCVTLKGNAGAGQLACEASCGARFQDIAGKCDPVQVTNAEVAAYAAGTALGHGTAGAADPVFWWKRHLTIIKEMAKFCGDVCFTGYCKDRATVDATCQAKVQKEAAPPAAPPAIKSDCTTTGITTTVASTTTATETITDTATTTATTTATETATITFTTTTITATETETADPSMSMIAPGAASTEAPTSLVDPALVAPVGAIGSPTGSMPGHIQQATVIQGAQYIGGITGKSATTKDVLNVLSGSVLQTGAISIAALTMAISLALVAASSLVMRFRRQHAPVVQTESLVTTSE